MLSYHQQGHQVIVGISFNLFWVSLLQQSNETFICNKEAQAFNKETQSFSGLNWLSWFLVYGNCRPLEADKCSRDGKGRRLRKSSGVLDVVVQGSKFRVGHTWDVEREHRGLFWEGIEPWAQGRDQGVAFSSAQPCPWVRVDISLSSFRPLLFALAYLCSRREVVTLY